MSAFADSEFYLFLAALYLPVLVFLLALAALYVQYTWDIADWWREWRGRWRKR